MRAKSISSTSAITANVFAADILGQVRFSVIELGRFIVPFQFSMLRLFVNIERQVRHDRMEVKSQTGCVSHVTSTVPWAERLDTSVENPTLCVVYSDLPLYNTR